MRLLSVQVKAVATPPKPIFTVYPLRGSVLPVCDVVEAFDVSKKMTPKNARDYLYSLGVDYENVMAYLPTVSYLERCLNKAPYQKI